MLLKRPEDDDLEGLEVEYVHTLDTHLDHLEPNFNGYSRAEYLRYSLHPLALAEYLRRAVVALEGHDYDALACRGISGMSFTFPLSVMVGKPPIVVRKEHEPCHGNHVEGYAAARRYIIVDDFVGTGETAREIIAAINKHWGATRTCMGVLQVTRLPRTDAIKKVQSEGAPWQLYPIKYEPVQQTLQWGKTMSAGKCIAAMDRATTGGDTTAKDNFVNDSFIALNRALTIDFLKTNTTGTGGPSNGPILYQATKDGQ